MKIIDNIEKKDYINFFNSCPYNHFLQSYEWGQASKGRKQNPIYLALVDDKNNIKAACMVLRKNTPFNMCYFYAPRGILIDYTNKELLKDFTEAMKVYLKKENAIYFKMDPGVIYQDIDIEANKIVDGKNNYELFNYLISLGYKHKGFTKLFTTNQPRYTFRINTKRPMEEIEKDINKTFMKTVKRSYNYDLEVIDDYDNDTFYKLMKDIAQKDSFNGYSKEFYDTFDKAFKAEKHVKYITIKIYPDKIIKKAEAELKPLKEALEKGEIPQKKMADTNNQIARIQKDINEFKPYEGKYPDGLISLILTCPTAGKAMWTLYIGNNSLATYTFAVNRSYYEAIKYAQENGYDYLDLFGVTGDPHTTIGNYAGVYEYKRKMGGTYTEFIGEFDLINKPIWNKLLPIIIKIYRKIKH